LSNHIIGKVIGVSGDGIDIELFSFTDDNEKSSGVPDDMRVSINIPDKGPIPLLIGQPGSFVKIPMGQYSLLCMVVDIKMVDKSFTSNEKREADLDRSILIANIKRVLSIMPVGTLSGSGKFDRGTDVLPTVNSPVQAVLPSTIDKVFDSFSEGNLTIGKLSLIPEQDAKISIDAFLSRHAAILGQTGGGKSWTVASILQKMMNEFKKSSVVLFDLHGEYKDVFGADADYIDANDVELPYWLMNCEELLGLMVDRAESSAPNQVAKFKELLQSAKEDHAENARLGIPKITVDTPVYFDLKSIIQEFERLDTEQVQGAKGLKNGPLVGEFTRLLMRVNSRLNDKRYDLIFSPTKFTTSASMTDLFNRILGEGAKPKKVVIIDFGAIPFDVRTSVISLILRCIFDFSYWYRKVNSESYPISVFCDEAHLYLNDKDPSCDPSRISAERISKEGRKYGVSLTVISQRPREVSSTILSQAGSFLCLRLSNPDDQSYVKNLLPDSVKGIVSMFAALRRGECILMGDSVIMPTRIKIDEPNPHPNSNDCSFYKEWKKDHAPIDVKNVLDAWRRQKA